MSKTLSGQTLLRTRHVLMLDYDHAFLHRPEENLEETCNFNGKVSWPLAHSVSRSNQ